MKQLISHYLCCHTTKHRSICRLIPWRIHFFYKSLKIAWAVKFIICSLRTSHIQATHPPCLLFEALLTWLMFGIKQHSEAEQDKQLEVSQCTPLLYFQICWWTVWLKHFVALARRMWPTWSCGGTVHGWGHFTPFHFFTSDNINVILDKGCSF